MKTKIMYEEENKDWLAIFIGIGLGLILVANLFLAANYFGILPLSQIPALGFLPKKPTPTPTPPETYAPPEAEETLEEKIIRVIGKGDKKEVQDILKNLAAAKAIAARDKSTMDIIEADGEYLLYRSITGRIKGYYYATGNPEILEILAQIREMARGHRRFDEKDWKIIVGGKEIEY